MKVSTLDPAYQEHLREEATLWNRTAHDEQKRFAPDYRYYRTTLPYRIYRQRYVKAMLSLISGDSRVLELGAYIGWFSLELARKGAKVDAHDIADEALDIGKRYFEQVRRQEQIAGTIEYHVTDLNAASFPRKTYDAVVIRNVLHHIANLEALLASVKDSMKPGGVLIIDDALPCGRLEALLIGGLLMVLPTDIPYSQKFQRVFRKGNVLRRTQELVDAKDASPFEGISGAESVTIVRKLFVVERYETFAAFVGTVASQVRLPLPFKIELLRFVNILDRILTRTHLLQGTSYFLVARRKPARRAAFSVVRGRTHIRL